MAEERDLELLDDYLTNQLSEQDRSAFEQKLKADPDLQHEYAMQKRLIEGIKDARIAELKYMLNQVAIPSGGGWNAIGSKALVGSVLTLMIAAAAFWYLREEPAKALEKENVLPRADQQTPADVRISPEPKAETSVAEQPSTVRQEQSPETDKNQTSAGTEHSKPSLAKRPDPLTAPSAKRSEAESTEGLTAPAITVDENNERYTFHYARQNGAITLYGPFEKGRYEVIQLKESNNNRLFLFYQDKYYPLDEAASHIRPLLPADDASLLQRLREQHN